MFPGSSETVYIAHGVKQDFSKYYLNYINLAYFLLAHEDLILKDAAWSLPQFVSSLIIQAANFCVLVTSVFFYLQAGHKELLQVIA